MMATWSARCNALSSPSPSPAMKRAKWDGLHLEPEAVSDWEPHPTPLSDRPSRLTEMPAHGSGQGAALDSGFSDGATPPPSGSFHPEDEDEDSDGRGKPVGASLKRAYFESEQRPAQASSHGSLLNDDDDLSCPLPETNNEPSSTASLALGLDQDSSSSSSSSSMSSASFREHPKGLLPPPPNGCSSSSAHQRQSAEDPDKSSQASNAGPSGLHHSSNSNESGYTNDEDDDDDDCVSNISGLSGLSDLSGADWKATAGPFSWVRSQMMKGVNPREVLQSLISSEAVIPKDLDNLTLWKIILNMLSEPPTRTKLTTVNTLQDVVGLIQSSRNIVVLTGAGVSVSCGIPDFRSRDGVYARLAVDFPDLPNPQAMFDIQYFRRDPRPFFKFAREIYPGQFKPSPCHRFIRALEKHERLLRNYTQNIDTLEQVVGIQQSVQCHGSFATATCTKCAHKCEADQIKADVFDQKIPYCPLCVERLALQGQVFDPLNLPIRPDPPLSCDTSLESVVTVGAGDQPQTQPPVDLGVGPTEPSPLLATSSKKQPSYLYEHPSVPGIMKPDIVFFGEGLGDAFHNAVAEDKNKVDLLIMIGSSLKVRPVALIPSSIPQSVPQILINREPLGHLTPDVELLGDCDGIVNQLCHLLGPDWHEPIHQKPLEEVSELLPPQPLAPDVDATTAAVPVTAPISLSSRLPEGTFFFQSPNRYIFPGAEIKEMDLCDSSSSSSSGGEEDDDGDESDDEAGAPSPSAYGTHHSPNDIDVVPSSSASFGVSSVILPAEAAANSTEVTLNNQASAAGQPLLGSPNQENSLLHTPLQVSSALSVSSVNIAVAPFTATGQVSTEGTMPVAPTAPSPADEVKAMTVADAISDKAGERALSKSD